MEAVIDGLEEGYAELAHGDPKVALGSFERALALDADSGEAIGGKALALGKTGDHAACLAFLGSAGEQITTVHPV